MQGWVSFHRKITEWEWYDDANTFRLFFHLVLMANHEEGKWQGNVIERGQHITSPDKLASQLKLTKSKIRTSLDKLKSTEEIAIKTTNRFTLVTVVNYDFYQNEGREIANNLANKSQTNRKQIATNNNEENEENEENEKEVYRKFKHLSMTIEESERIINDGYTKLQLDNVLDDIENYAKNKSYISLNLTARKWLKKDSSKSKQTLIGAESSNTLGKRKAGGLSGQ